MVKVSYSLSQWFWIILLCCVVVFVWLPLSPLYSPVPSDDPSVYLYVGSAMLDGQKLYQDIWDHKQPVTYAIFALGQILTPDSLWGIWILEGISLIVAVVAGYRALCYFTGRKWSFVAISTALIVLIKVIWGYSVEEFSLPFQMLIIFSAMALPEQHEKSSAGGWLSLLMGLATGLVFFLKPNFITVSACVVVYLVLRWAFLREHRIFGWLSSMAAGFTLIAASVWAWLSLNGIWADYYDAVYVFNLSYSGLGPVEWARAIQEALKMISSIPGFLLGFVLWLSGIWFAVRQTQTYWLELLSSKYTPAVMSIFGGCFVGVSLLGEVFGSSPGFSLIQVLVLFLGVFLVGMGIWGKKLPGCWAEKLKVTQPEPLSNPRLLRALILAVLFLPSAIVSISYTGRNYTYYYVVLFPVLVMLYGVVPAVLGHKKPILKKYIYAFTNVLLIVVLAIPASWIWKAYQKPLNPPIPEIAQYIRSHTNPDDVIMVWGKDTTYVYFVSDRRAPTRYFYQAAVYQPDYAESHAVVDEILLDLTLKPPKLFIEGGTGPDLIQDPGNCRADADDESNPTHELAAFICDRYFWVEDLDELHVFELKN